MVIGMKRVRMARGRGACCAASRHERNRSSHQSNPSLTLVRSNVFNPTQVSPSISSRSVFSSISLTLRGTDRILFKSTIEPPPEEEDEEERTSREPAAPALHPSRSSAFVSALRDLTHAPLTSTLRPRSADADLDQTIRARRGSAEDRHLRFSDVFARPRRPSASSESEAGQAGRGAKESMPRTKSLQPGQLRRQHSGANSVGTDDTESKGKKAFWRRVTSFPALNTMHGGSVSAPSSPQLQAAASKSSPLASPALTSSPVLQSATALREPSYFADATHASSTSAPTTPTTPTRRAPRKMFTLSSNSPPSSPDEIRIPPSQTVNFAPSPSPIEAPPLPRANSEQALATSARSHSPVAHNPSSFSRRPIRSVSGSVLPSASTSAAASPRESPSPTDPAPHVQTSTASLNTRFKSFLNSIPLPFLSAPTSIRSLSATTTNSAKVARRKKYGPRCGEIHVITYDSVPDLAKMGAVSDHRPVFLSCAIGVAERDHSEE